MLCVLFFVYFIYFCASERDIRYHKYSLRFAVSVRVSLFTQFVSYHGKSISCIKQEKKSCAKFGIQSFWGWRRLRENSAFLTPLINKDNFVTFFVCFDCLRNADAPNYSKIVITFDIKGKKIIWNSFATAVILFCPQTNCTLTSVNWKVQERFFECEKNAFLMPFAVNTCGVKFAQFIYN